MYTVDDLDRVVPLSGLPDPSPSAPLPVVVATEHRVLVAYLVAETDDEGAANLEETGRVAVVAFHGSRDLRFGAPNDEAFQGHPLAARGLEPYAAWRVDHSSWIRQLERMNSVHPMHRPEAFAHLIHVVLAFHDSTFECVADSYRVVEIQSGSVNQAVLRVLTQLPE